jgi:hypothetical protein
MIRRAPEGEGPRSITRRQHKTHPPTHPDPPTTPHHTYTHLLPRRARRRQLFLGPRHVPARGGFGEVGVVVAGGPEARVEHQGAEARGGVPVGVWGVWGGGGVVGVGVVWGL